MTENRRSLPSWMVKKKEKAKEEPLKSRRKRKLARDAFYCLNEKELVEAAVHILTNAACEDAVLQIDRKVEENAVDTWKERPSTKTIAKLVMEESLDGGDVQDTMCVSETDLDIAELATLPYTKSPQHEEPEGQRSGPVRDHDGLMNVEKEVTREKPSQMPADAMDEEEEDDDDALQLVREIFFS